VTNEEIPHNFPKPHMDMLLQSTDYPVPPDKFDALAAYDGSVIAERTKGELAARCDMEEANFLALNLAHDIVTGIRSVAQARQFYAEVMQEKRPTEYLEGLRFQVPRTAQGDPDRQLMASRCDLVGYRHFLPLLGKRVERGPLQSVQDMWLLDPPLVGAVPHEAKQLNAVRVAINDDLRTQFACPMQAHIIEVALLWLESISRARSCSLAACNMSSRSISPRQRLCLGVLADQTTLLSWLHRDQWARGMATKVGCRPS